MQSRTYLILVLFLLLPAACVDQPPPDDGFTYTHVRPAVDPADGPLAPLHWMLGEWAYGDDTESWKLQGSRMLGERLRTETWANGKTTRFDPPRLEHLTIEPRDGTLVYTLSVDGEPTRVWKLAGSANLDNVMFGDPYTANRVSYQRYASFLSISVRGPETPGFSMDFEPVSAKTTSTIITAEPSK